MILTTTTNNNTDTLKIIEKATSKKKRKFSRNRKKGWRKEIDLADIEDAKEERDREERYGGAVSEKQSSEMFVLDLGPYQKTTTVKTKSISRKKEPVKEVIKSVDGFKISNKKTINLNKLRSYKYLRGLPGVKAISKKKPTQPQNIPKKIKNMKKVIDGSEKGKDKLVKTLKDSQKGIRNNLQRRGVRLAHRFRKDVWGQDAFYDGPVRLDKKTDIERSYLEEPMLTITQKLKPNKKKGRAKPNILAAVPIPKPGESYNPSKKSHEKLLQSAADQIVNRLQKRKKDMQKVKRQLPGANAGLTEKEYYQEMMEGLPLDVNVKGKIISNEGEFEEDIEDVKELENQENEISAGHVNPSCHERKTEKKKKTEKRIKKRDIRVRERKLKKIREDGIIGAKKFNKTAKAIEKDEKILKEVQKLERRERESTRVKTLNKHKFRRMNIAAPLSEDLPDSLRDAKHFSNPLDERYESITKRNLVDVRGPNRFKKAPRKRKPCKKRSVKDLDPCDYLEPEIVKALGL